MPAVSVIVPTFNAARYVGAAIDSALDQSFRECEVIVVDDGSTDDTEAVISRYGSRVRYIRQPNQGVSAARNRGMRESTGHYVAFLDADDTWLPGKLAQQVEALERSTSCRACFSAYIICGENLEHLTVRRTPWREATLDHLLVHGNVVGLPSTVLCERSLFSPVGEFDVALSQCADWDMWIRLATTTDFLYVDEPLVTYRQHRSNMSRDAELLERDSVRVLTKGFALELLPSGVGLKRRAAFGRNYMALAGTYFYARRYRDFLRCATRSLVLDPRGVGYLAGFPTRAFGRLRYGGRPQGQWVR